MTSNPTEHHPRSYPRYYPRSLGSIWEHRNKKSKRKRTEQSFLVPLSEIQENDYDLSINRYREIVYEEIEYDSPSKIIGDIKALDEERSKASADLEKLIAG